MLHSISSTENEFDRNKLSKKGGKIEEVKKGIENDRVLHTNLLQGGYAVSTLIMKCASMTPKVALMTVTTVPYSIPNKYLYRINCIIQNFINVFINGNTSQRATTTASNVDCM